MRVKIHCRYFFLLFICFFFAGVVSQSALAQWYWPVPNAPRNNNSITQWASGGANGHPGIDITGSEGWPIYASRTGKVIGVGFSPASAYCDDNTGCHNCVPAYGPNGVQNVCQGGYTIVIDHYDKYYSIYAHLRDMPSLKIGDTVTGGKTVIGILGNTGRSTGPHLHFSIKYDNYNGITTGLQTAYLNNLSNFVDGNYTPTCGNGIYGNDQKGVSINICDAPYTTYAKKTGGSGAWAPGGASTNWYAAARVNDLTGVDVPIMDGSTWINTAESYGFTVSKEPNADPNWVHGYGIASKRLAVWKDHIRVIEGVNTQTQMILFSNGDGNSKYAANGYCGMEERSFTDFESDGRWFGDFLGYVYLAKVKPEGAFESVTTTDDGQITISGYAYDPKSPNTNIDLHIAIVNADLPGEEKTLKVNNVQRTDGKKGGFSLTFPVNVRGYYYIAVEALGTTVNSDSSDYTDLGYKYFTLEKALYPREITLNQSSLSLEKGSTGNLSVSSYLPSEAQNKTVTWTSSDTSIATVTSAGKVTAKGVGTATITATVKDRAAVKAECTVTVTAPPTIRPTSVTLNKTSAELTVNDKLNLTTTVLPSNTNVSYNIRWTSSDTSVATVSNGVVTAVGEGTAKITVSVKSDFSSLITFCKTSCTITVVQPAEPSCDWVEKSYLPPNVNPDEWEIEVKNHYSQTGSTSPGSGWTQTDSTTRYVESGAPYTTYKDLGSDTDTRKFIKKVWYHWCGHPQHKDWVELQIESNYPYYDEKEMDSSIFEDRYQYQDSNFSVTQVSQHELWWKSGTKAGTRVECDNGGERWYEGWKYQNYTAVTENTWVRDSEWLSLDQLDSNATSVSYRFRLKNCEPVSYTVTFKVVNGSWDDGTTADKKVTLEGIASDTLTLTEAQIPTAGTKPAANYKTGKWGVTPNTETPITADTTYTYNYTLKNAISSTVTFKVVNGSWDDETTADKTVTLNGYEGDTLKLTTAQIPAVGTKPEANFKAGSWDTTPSAETAILGNKTFTYTYAAKNNITRTVTFKVVNGSWDDGTTADKTVTLTGYEGDSLKLTQSQIPAVGSKPNETYKAGSWDTNPTTSTVITANTTYTYTYAVDENDDRIKLIVSSERARPGEEVTVAVSIENNPGIALLRMEVSFDRTKLEIVKKNPDEFPNFDLLDSGLTGWEGNDNGSKTQFWWDSNKDTNFTGEIVKLKFRVLDGAEKGDTAITISPVEDGILNSALVDYIPVIQSGKVTIYKNIPGDINGDGKVSSKDLLLLKQYLAWLPVTLVGNADVNADGKVSSKDLLLLKQYLAWLPVTLY